MKIVNQRTYALEVIGRIAQPGEAIDVPDELGERLLEQPANWAKPTTSKKSDASDGDEKENDQ